MPYSFTNRQGKTYYVRGVESKKGKMRYYVTTSKKNDDLIDFLPDGFEVVELPEEAKVVMRKIKPIFSTYEEREIVKDAIEELSAIKIFFIHGIEDYIYVYHSQFCSITGFEESLSIEEVEEIFGKEIIKWIRYLTNFRFQLIDKKNRLYQAERIVHLGAFGHDFYPVGEVGLIEDLAKKYAPHFGRETYLKIPPKGYEDEFEDVGI